MAGAWDFNNISIRGINMNIYTNKENRKFVVIKESDGKWHSHSYARYIVEENIGRKLDKTEEIRHIDGDKTNDNINNLQIINSTAHRQMHTPLKYKDTIEKCYICGNEFTVTAKQHSEKYRNRIRKSNSADKYFCSRSCSGIYGQRIQQEHQKEKSSE